MCWGNLKELTWLPNYTNVSLLTDHIGDDSLNATWQTVLTACFSPSLLWPFEGQDGHFWVSQDPPNRPSGALLTPGNILGNRAAGILGRKPEKPWMSWKVSCPSPCFLTVLLLFQDRVLSQKFNHTFRNFSLSYIHFYSFSLIHLFIKYILSGCCV